MIRRRNDWQDTGAVLRLFGEKVSVARRQYRAYVELGISMAKLSRRMNVSVMAVSYAVQRGEKIAREFNFSL